MKAETKFYVNDKVWIIDGLKAKEYPIHSIHVEFKKEDTKILVYLNVGTEEDYKCKIIEEKHCYSSREELINSL